MSRQTSHLSAWEPSPAQAWRVDVAQVPRRVYTLHMIAIGALLCAHLLVYLFVPQFNNEALSKVGTVFDLGEETSIPNFFPGTMLMATAFVAAAIALHHKARASRTWRSWGLASAALTFLAFDEGAMLHDRLSQVIETNVAPQGLFYIGWTLPYMFVVLAAVLAGLPLLRSLSPRTTFRLVQAGALYVFGALGLEMVEGALLEQSVPHGTSFREALMIGVPPAWAVLVTVEEACEMVAVALALRGLLLHLTEDIGIARLTISHQFPASPNPHHAARSPERLAKPTKA